ncbi:phytoene desaturase family protein [Chitinivibrio alkaliphilus]|uniref:Amine oxidase domain-containing protein n=1 Tax=Chitinivibrio alkaliphilus ACht1 TaxID=1313304 RepID=U7D5X9_9BACT|nr:NAD(P)/FAD-dependent oxidoreductase [Chitinivibrio alkaliphilus]ERP31333.1 hypothetical protein CALK_1822 [Chitinivibrio alkaliphilus ACht1]
MEKRYDALILGAGLGGLFAGAKLAKEGKSVLVLEKHTIPGGYASVFKRKGYTFEASLHALNDVTTPSSQNYKIFNEFGLMDSLNFFRVPEFFALRGKNVDITISDSLTGIREDLLATFPDEAKAIDTYLTTVEKIYHQIRKYKQLGWKLFLLGPFIPLVFRQMIGNLRKSTGAFMDELTDNEDLKITLCALTHYWHHDPYKYSFVHHCAATGSYLSGGAAFLEEGSFGISKHLASYIQAHGGEIRYGVEVQKTLVSKGVAEGAVYYDLTTKQRNTAYGTHIVANIPYPLLVQSLPEEYQDTFTDRYGAYSLSSSMFCLYFGLQNPLRELGGTKYSTIILPDEVTSLRDFKSYYLSEDYGSRIMDLTDYSILDRFDPADKPTATVVVIDTMDAWKNLSHEAYAAKKEKHTEEILSRLEKFLPGFRDNLTHVEGATPLTNQRYTSNPDGAIYGYAQDVKQMGPFRPKEETPVKNLYVASGWGSPGGGMTAVAKAGYSTATRILKNKPFTEESFTLSSFFVDMGRASVYIYTLPRRFTMSKIKKMCKVKGFKEAKEELLQEVANPKYICKKCLRVSSNEKKVCKSKEI